MNSGGDSNKGRKGGMREEIKRIDLWQRKYRHVSALCQSIGGEELIKALTDGMGKGAFYGSSFTESTPGDACIRK